MNTMADACNGYVSRTPIPEILPTERRLYFTATLQQLISHAQVEVADFQESSLPTTSTIRS